MTKNSNYENLQFHRTVNTISALPASFPLHWHKYVEMVAVPENVKLSQSPILTINQTPYELAPGDILFIWPGELHEISANDDRQLMGLQFSSDHFNDLSDFIPLLNTFRTYHLIRRSEQPLLSASMQKRIQDIFEIQRSQNTFRGVEALIYLYRLFIDFGEFIRNDAPNDGEKATAGKTLEKMNIACNYIVDNCERELTLESVANYVGFSTCYFSRVFKQTTQYNFVEYLTLQRVKRAQLLLSDSNMTVTEISYQSGFKSLSTFNRVFKQIRGCSPSEYRKYYLV